MQWAKNGVKAFTLAALAAAALTLSTCADKEGESKQIAAKVNGDEISVLELNQAVQRLGNLNQAQVPQAQKQVLDRLVDQQLLVQQAVEKKLDRDPRVVRAIEAARRQVLAQAYVEQVMGAAEKAGDAQIKEFFDTHPELFAERRIYRFTQVTIAAPAERQADIRSRLEELDRQPDKQRILGQLADWLKAQNIQFRATQATQAAEQLPLESLAKYHKMNVGDLMLTVAPQGLIVSQLVAVQTQPLGEAQARPFIEQFLQNRARLKLSEDEMKRLRVAAKIEYVGEFKNLGEALPSSAPKAP